MFHLGGGQRPRPLAGVCSRRRTLPGSFCASRQSRLDTLELITVCRLIRQNWNLEFGSIGPCSHHVVKLPVSVCLSSIDFVLGTGQVLFWRYGDRQLIKMRLCEWLIETDRNSGAPESSEITKPRPGLIYAVFWTTIPCRTTDVGPNLVAPVALRQMPLQPPNPAYLWGQG